MQNVHCDGCGFVEPMDTPKKQRKILPVAIQVENDPRFPEGTDKHDADLCTSCRGLLLHTYFKVPMGDKLELAVPTFISPAELKEDAVRS